MTAKQIVGGRLYRLVTRGGWRGWLTLAVAAFLFMLCALLFTRGTDYRDDPSALVPRSADVYAETRDLPGLLRTAGAWRLWRGEKRAAPGGGEGGGALERELALLISSRAGGLPVNPSFRWIADSRGAAWCVSRDGDGAASWAVYMKLESPEAALREIEVEPGMTLTATRGERGGDGVFSLTGKDGRAAVVGVAGPWLILSGDAKLPEFALDAVARPGVSLAETGLLPRWRGEAAARGLFSPAYAAGAGMAFGPLFAPESASDWLAPEARAAYTASLGRNGGVEMNFTSGELSAAAPGGGRRVLGGILLAAVALGSLGVMLAVLLVMLGWGGWLKAVAIRNGVETAEEPENVEPSEAFLEDAQAGGEEKKAENTPEKE